MAEEKQYREPFDESNVEWLLAFHLVKHTNDPLLLTGRAGTGKSTFLRMLRERLGKKLVVVAPTGIAAVNVQGVTVHSQFLLPPRPLIPGDKGIRKMSADSQRHKVLREMDVLVIDEVSMLRADMVDAIDVSLRRNLRKPHQPFGGKQVLFIGDMFQLEPVVQQTRGFELYDQFYNSPYFFDAKAFTQMDLPVVELKKIYRQKDRDFIDLLEKVRTASATASDLRAINARCHIREAAGDFRITLTSTNAMAYRVNQQRLEQLDGEEETYMGLVEGDFSNSRFPTDEELRLKVGAQVMFVRNDIYKRWINGTIGKVVKLTPESVFVEMENGLKVEVEAMTWENTEYHYDAEKQSIEAEVKGTFCQLPLRLAWAVTIHKSQGLTFEKVAIDFGRGTFASGQAYVALSRCRTLEGLALKRPLQPRDIILEPRIRDFADYCAKREKKLQQEVQGMQLGLGL